MKVLVVGGGGREHAIIKSVKNSPLCDELYAVPGNGGIAQDAICTDIAATDIECVVDFAVEKEIDFVIVAPDDPLVMGLVDKLHEKNIKCFGPSMAAAQIEGSKVFSKHLMEKYQIPTAGYNVFDDVKSAKEYIKSKNEYPVVIKADGLAYGKGVIIAVDEKEAMNALESIMNDKVFGNSGDQVVIEEFKNIEL